MDIYKLKREYERTHPDGHYFDRDTLKWFGESLSTMRVLKGTVEITDCLGVTHTCYMISKLSRNYPGGARRTYAYFDINTFDDVRKGDK